MGYIYTELPAIPVPDGCYVNGKSKQVSRYYYVNGKRHRHVIGHATTDGMMFANDIFRTYYPAEWDAAFGDRAPGASTLMAGLYIAFLALGWSTGLYPALQGSLGPSCSNVFMDLALYLIRHKSSAMRYFREKMAHQVLFARKPLSPSFISEFLADKSNQDALDRFRDAWLAKCTENGRREVWLSVDGSNVDSHLFESGLAAYGYSKSNNATPIISFIWAVDASDGTPITWFVNPGNTPDCKAFDGILRYLANSSLDVKGVILDRGFATQDVLDLIRAKDLDYIVMLKKNQAGFAYMMQKHGEELRKLLVNGIEKEGTVSARVDKAKVFQKSEVESCIALYYSAENHNKRMAELFANAMDAIDSAEKDIVLGKEVSFPDEVREFLSLKFDESGNVMGVLRDQDKFDAALKDSGYFAIASSAAKTAREILNTYGMRATSECQFSCLKNQFGLDTMGVYGDESVKTCMALGFVAVALRNEFKNACKELKLDTNVMLDALDRVELLLKPNGDYEATAGYSQKVGLLLSHLGVSLDHLKQVAVELGIEEKERIVDQVRKLRVTEERRGRGRIKGSKNKKTLEREAREAELREKGQLPPKRRPGRPKSQKTLEKEAREAELRAKGELPEKRGPGRPKGSKNKKTLEREARLKARGESSEKRGPGRPKGSKNRKTLEREARKARTARRNAEKRQKEVKNQHDYSELNKDEPQDKHFQEHQNQMSISDGSQATLRGGSLTAQKEKSENFNSPQNPPSDDAFE